MRRGNALLIVILLITVLATVALAVGNLTLAEVKMQSGMEDSVIAYHAAEAGIEDGLLRWRHDRNVETMDTATAPSTNTTDNVERVDLAASNSTSFSRYVNPDDAVADPTRQYYDLKIWYRDSVVGEYDHFADMMGASRGWQLSPILKQDETLELSAVAGTEIFYLKAKPTEGCVIGSDRPLLSIKEMKPTNIDTSSRVEQFVDNSIRSFTIQATVANGKIRVKPWGCDIHYAIQSDEDVLIDSGTTVIESTGHYGGAKRKLVAKINRKSGTLLGIYDFVLYSGKGNVE